MGGTRKASAGYLQATAAPGEGGYALCDLLLGESRASIPDLDAVEAQVITAG